MDKICAQIGQSGAVLLIAHTAPDGDTLGSCFALFEALEQLGKKVCVICDCDMPFYLKDIPYASRLSLVPSFDAQLVISVDCADIERMGKSAQYFEKVPKKIVIDHHPTNSGFGQWNCIKPSAGATGEIIWELLKRLRVNITPTIAQNIYVALATDTGNFSYSNTTPDTFRIASEALSFGFDISEINNRLFRLRAKEKTKLIGVAIVNMNMHVGDKVAMSVVTAKEMNEIGAVSADTEGIIDFLRDVEGVEIAAFLHESFSEPDTFKVSLRSKYYANVSTIAARFAGGGHKFAAGLTLHGTKDKVCSELLSAINEELERC